MNSWRGLERLVVPFEQGRVIEAINLAQDELNISSLITDQIQLMLFLSSANLRLAPLGFGAAARDAEQFSSKAIKIASDEDSLIEAKSQLCECYAWSLRRSLAIEQLSSLPISANFYLLFAKNAIFSSDILSASNYLEKAQQAYAQSEVDTLLHQDILYFQAITHYAQQDLHLAEDCIDSVVSYFSADHGYFHYNYLLTRALILKLLIEIDTKNQRKISAKIAKLLSNQDREISVALESLTNKIMTFKS